jgi:hypothetical protein
MKIKISISAEIPMQQLLEEFGQRVINTMLNREADDLHTVKFDGIKGNNVKHCHFICTKFLMKHARRGDKLLVLFTNPHPTQRTQIVHSIVVSHDRTIVCDIWDSQNEDAANYPIERTSLDLSQEPYKYTYENKTTGRESVLYGYLIDVENLVTRARNT